MADEQTPVPSNHDRSFAWSPNGTLGFVRGDDLWVGHRRIASGLARKLAPNPNARRGEALDFSSDGRLIAVCFGKVMRQMLLYLMRIRCRTFPPTIIPTLIRRDSNM